ncbi:hypothetical protein LTR36_005586 [Oleoguttula mirabilis]|uniref:GDP/GTP exchange factor Sec2 N-terminal domain-containing protein n=1 Tax=Oleoguttula mirabilis TaxID=1507867 RepID=A0AAV9JE45_9PEZI|nr:hypothetical protein LTR36_005586 [Oleoguttula mirabilis]
MPSYSFLFASTWGSNVAASLTRPSTLSRSVTPSPVAPRKAPLPLPHQLVKSSSSPHIHQPGAAENMATVAMPLRREEHTTDMDTRTPSPTQSSGSTDSAADTYKPDLSAEVAMLSTKLVNAINYQTNLDDSLQQTRHELESARKELARVRAQKKETDDMITNGVLVRKAHVDITMAKLREELAVERSAREAAEKAKKETEGELEMLTTALFEEANTMVAAARKDTEAVEKRSSQLRGQLSDTELLLASQTEQLHDLKGVMERMEQASEHDARDSSVPSTPINSTTGAWDALQLSPNGVGPAEVSPDHPLHFSQLLIPVMRNDISAYTDFQELLSLARRAAPHSRHDSSSANNLSSSSQTNLAMSSPIPGAFSFGSSSSANNSPSSTTFGGTTQSTPPLKDSRFYKRTMIEDIEPTLRLDLAPGLSFLSRRSVLSSLLSGSLAVEPFMPATKFYGPVFACALCGEQRKKEPYVRKYRFRTSEEESAQRYPLCDYCLGRIRAAGDFVGFLRMVRDGHWRCESDEEAKGAWEEAVRLRERMFWARLGGGVVPALQHVVRREVNGNGSPSTTAGIKSVRQSLESIPERSARENAVAARSAVTVHEASGAREQSEQDGGVVVRDVTPQPQQHQRPISTSEGGIGQAIIGASSGVMATARPDVSPSRPAEPSQGVPLPEDGAADAVPAEPSSTLHAEESGEEQPTTPFEDAQSDTPEQQLQASEQLLREAEASATAPAPPPSAPQAMEELRGDPANAGVPTVNEPEAEAVDDDPAAESQQPFPALTERRPSGVLARVRAMEASAQRQPAEKKFPGAFE